MSSLLDLIRAKKTEIAQATGDIRKTIKPADGTSRYRILPSWKFEIKGDKISFKDEQFWHDFGQHFIKKDGKILAVMNCESKTHGKNCPVCHAIEAGIHSSTDDEMIQALTGAKSKTRFLVNAIDVARNPGVVEILELPSTAFNALLDVIQSHSEDGVEILHLQEGRDILVKREGTGLKTKYTVMVSPKGSSLPVSIMTQAHNLDDYVGSVSESTKNRALGAVQAVLGHSSLAAGEQELLPAPKKASATRFASIEDEDDEVPVSAPAKVKKDVTDVKAKPAPSAEVDDDDLEAILNGIES